MHKYAGNLSRTSAQGRDGDGGGVKRRSSGSSNLKRITHIYTVYLQVMHYF